jgi:hypothetical protein
VHERKRKAQKQSKRGQRAKVLPHSTWFASLQRQRVYKATETSRPQASAGRTQTLTERGVFSQPRLLGVLAAARAARRVAARRTSSASAAKRGEVRGQPVRASTAAARRLASALRAPAGIGPARRVAGVPVGPLRVARAGSAETHDGRAVAARARLLAVALTRPVSTRHGLCVSVTQCRGRCATLRPHRRSCDADGDNRTVFPHQAASAARAGGAETKSEKINARRGRQAVRRGRISAATKRRRRASEGRASDFRREAREGEARARRGANRAGPCLARIR